jgi:hypothetical protein
MPEKTPRINRKSRTYRLNPDYLKELARVILEATEDAGRRIEGTETRRGSFVDRDALKGFARELRIKVGVALASGGLKSDFRLSLPDKPHLSNAIWDTASTQPSKLPLCISSKPTENGWKRTIIWGRMTKDQK